MDRDNGIINDAKICTYNITNTGDSAGVVPKLGQCHRPAMSKIFFCLKVWMYWGTGMIASSSTCCPHPGRVIRDLSRLLDAVYGIVRKH